MKDILLEELKKESFPNLSLFLKDEALKELPKLLEELLDERKNEIDSFLRKKNENIKFDDLIHESLLSYLRTILHNLNQTNQNLELRNIISKFRSKIEDFENQLAYSKKYYNKILRIKNNLSLNSDQKRILELKIKDYKQNSGDKNLFQNKKQKNQKNRKT